MSDAIFPLSTKIWSLSVIPIQSPTSYSFFALGHTSSVLTFTISFEGRKISLVPLLILPDSILPTIILLSPNLYISWTGNLMISDLSLSWILYSSRIWTNEKPLYQTVSLLKVTILSPFLDDIGIDDYDLIPIFERNFSSLDLISINLFSE